MTSQELAHFTGYRDIILKKANRNGGEMNSRVLVRRITSNTNNYGGIMFQDITRNVILRFTSRSGGKGGCARGGRVKTKSGHRRICDII
jgi:hypothetical protein